MQRIIKEIKIKKKIFVLAAVVCAIAVGAFYLWHDLHLSASGSVSLPDIVVEDIDIERTIGDKKWKLLSPRVEHKDGLIYGASLDVTVTEPNGKITQIHAEKGVFARESNDVTMVNANGKVRNKSKEYCFNSGKVNYEASSEIWYFADNFTLTAGHQMVIGGRAGYYDMKSGICRITDKGMITWSN